MGPHTHLGPSLDGDGVLWLKLTVHLSHFLTDKGLFFLLEFVLSLRCMHTKTTNYCESFI